MSGTTLYERPRKYNVAKLRVHDYLYDSAYIVSDARDFARTAFKAAMQSAQLHIQPVYKTMFSELRKYPRSYVVYHPNCRLPDHMDLSYSSYLSKVQSFECTPAPQIDGKDRYKFAAYPKKVLPLKKSVPDFHPPSARSVVVQQTRPVTRGTQSLYRESSAQTRPWQPDSKVARDVSETPEVLYLDKMDWGPGKPYRTGDLPADFHTTEIINKMRHARLWNQVVEKGAFPKWMKKTDAIIEDVEMKDWIFREAEIDELQEIRLGLLHRLQSQKRQKQNTRSSRKLAKLWITKKEEMQKKVEHIRHNMEREVRKLTALHASGGRDGKVASMRASRGHGSMTTAAIDPTSDLHAPVARHGYQGRKRHAEIVYDPNLLSLEDHKACSEPPAWLDNCGQNLKKTCSGHHLPSAENTLCERETKWSEEFLEQLHNDLIKARLGASALAAPAPPLTVLKPRRSDGPARPPTPEVESVPDEEECSHQAALLLQRVLRGRAVQTLMYEGRSRAAELTEELKTTHGLQREDRARIAKDEARARDFNAVRTEIEQKDDAISAMVDELCGGAVSAALDFLEKELRRLKDERRNHAFVLIALREKTMREAAEAGRRQKELHRLREHDEMFKQILGVTQETVDVYLQEIIEEGVELAAEEDAVQMARAQADKIEAFNSHGSMSTAEEHETVAELVQQFLLPEAHKMASRQRIAAKQEARAQAARDAIFGLMDDAEIPEKYCLRCGMLLGDQCYCKVCPKDQQPIETIARDDQRWKYTTEEPPTPEKSLEERYPPKHEIRCMLDTLIDEAVLKAREHTAVINMLRYEYQHALRFNLEVALDVKEMMDILIDNATDLSPPPRPFRASDYHHYMQRIIVDSLGRFRAPKRTLSTSELPSDIRRHEDEQRALEDSTCYCKATLAEIARGKPQTDTGEIDESKLLPSELRVLEELRRCKCDAELAALTQKQAAPPEVSFPEERTEEITKEPETPQAE